MKTGQRVRANLDTWNKGDFERNGQLDALGKDFGGSGTVVTPAKRNRGWMLCGEKDGDICVSVCWDRGDGSTFLYSVEGGQLVLDELKHEQPSLAEVFTQNVSSVAVFCEANPTNTKYADKDAVYLTGERITGQEGFEWSYDTNTFFTDSSGLVCEVLGESGWPGFSDALHQLQSYAQSDMGRSEEGRTGILSDQRLYPPEAPRIVGPKTVYQFFKDECPTSQSRPKWCNVVHHPEKTIKAGDVVVHESRSVGLHGGVMVALSAMIKLPGVLNGEPHIVVAEATATRANGSLYSDGGIQLNRVCARQPSDSKFEVKIGNYWVDAKAGRLLG